MAKLPFVITRGVISGVMCGYLADRDDKVIVLQEARQIWRWRGANTLTGLSQTGAHMTEYTRIDKPAERVELSVGDIGSVLFCSPDAEANLKQSRWL